MDYGLKAVLDGHIPMSNIAFSMPRRTAGTSLQASTANTDACDGQACSTYTAIA